MPKTAFSHVRTWVFDLDNTLYPPGARLFDQIEDLMNSYIVSRLGVDLAQAMHLRDQYWRDHGTTLAGLIAHHGIDPDEFLDVVHDIELSALAPAPDLATAIHALPGRRIVYTNGSRSHAARVTAALGLTGAFDALYGVEDAEYVPKPQQSAFAKVFALAALAPAESAMFEDDPRNLEVPHMLGMKTVLVGPAIDAPHVHFTTEDLADFLSRLV